MNFYIQQSIHINLIRIDSIMNSAVLQIGSSGIIKPVSYLSNTGGFMEPAPEAEAPDFETGTHFESPAVPLTTARGRVSQDL
ncbi:MULTISPECIES: spore germination protein GerPB [Bacillus]|uniref:spore germination protein GerPB n=1 Tax=Bacillus TaxID=1386 RepID=UPI000C76E238|nr:MULTISPECIES: spore germination protein GerPB [Bacillus]PLR87371.1 spore gernimation protein [Bacillus sp. V33-4]RSK46926.1 spore gernimation protein [Bacillus canaveralius]